MALAKGHYQVELYGSADTMCATSAFAEVCCNFGQNILKTQSLNETPEGYKSLISSILFTLQEDHSDIEIRVHVSELCNARLELLEISKISSEVDMPILVAIDHPSPFYSSSINPQSDSEKPLTFLALGTCSLNPILEVASDFGIVCDHYLMETGINDAVPDKDILLRKNYDGYLVGLTLRHILEFASSNRDELRFWKESEDGRTDYFLSCVRYMEEKILQLAEILTDISCFFMTFIEPRASYSGLIIHSEMLDNKLFVQKLNRELKKLLGKTRNFFCLEVNDILNEIGREGLQDDYIWSSSHASFLDDWDVSFDKHRILASAPPSRNHDISRKKNLYGQKLWKQVSDAIKIIKRIDAIKLIIVDLDDTLWRGVAAEDDYDIALRREGWPFGFVEALLVFKSRGGLLAICSKNDHDATIERLEQIWGNCITADDFSSIQINWNSKSENIRKILADVNVLAQNTLFVDDNPREAQEVHEVIKGIRILNANHYDWRNTIIERQEFQVSTITRESLNRTKLVQATIQRSLSMDRIDRDVWLASQNIEQEFSVLYNINGKEFDRAFELINKTNQFNTTGKRWEISEFSKLFSSGGNIILSSLKDKNSNNGIIAAAIIENDLIVQVVLSCRVFGLGAEISLAHVACRIILNNHLRVRANFVETGKNLSCLKYYEASGFVNSENSLWTSSVPEIPTWIEVKGDIDSLVLQVNGNKEVAGQIRTPR